LPHDVGWRFTFTALLLFLHQTENKEKEEETKGRKEENGGIVLSMQDQQVFAYV
jgi:hypothetical protein